MVSKPTLGQQPQTQLILRGLVPKDQPAEPLGFQFFQKLSEERYRSERNSPGKTLKWVKPNLGLQNGRQIL